VRLAALLLLVSDALVGLLVWLAAYVLRSTRPGGSVVEWGSYPPQTAVVVGGFAVSGHRKGSTEHNQCQGGRRADRAGASKDESRAPLTRREDL
jgi:hypothetical protein